MARLPSPWITLVTFVLGVIGGVLLDRAIGGPEGLTVGITVLLIPGTLAFVGPFAQQYWSNRFSTEVTNRARFKEHADQLVDRVFWPISNAMLSYDVANFAWGGLGGYRVIVRVSSGGSQNMESLVPWTFAREHIIADRNAGPTLLEVERRTKLGRDEKQRLDRNTGVALEAALRAEFGFDFVSASPETGWSEWPPNALWYPDTLVNWLRNDRALQTVEVQEGSITHSNGDPPTQIQKLMMNGMQALQVRAPLTLDSERFRAVYQAVRTNDVLRGQTRSALQRAKDDADIVRQLALLISELAEAVEATETLLPGTCPACRHLSPR